MSNWLRDPRNKELVILLASVAAFLFLAIPTIQQFGDHPAILVVAIASIAGGVTVISLPAILSIRRQERLQAANAHSAENVAASTTLSLRKGRSYAVMAMMTLVSALYQAFAINTADWPLGHSTPIILLSNFSILAAVIGLIEICRQRNSRP